MYSRIIGAVCIVLCGVLTGNAASNSLKARFERLDGIISSFLAIKAKLVLNLSPIPDILRELSEKNNELGALYTKICEKYDSESISIQEIWSDCFAEYTAELGYETAQIICSLGDVLGKYDVSEQCSAIDYALARLNNNLEEFRKDYVNQGSLYRKLGTALGIGVAVMLM